MSRVTVCVVDRSRLIREATKLFLAGVEFEVAAEAASLSEAIDLIERGCRVDLFLLDYASTELDLALRIRELAPGARIALFATELTAAKVSQALRIGLDGCVDKNLSAPSLGNYLKLVMAGERVVPYGVAADLFNTPATPSLQSPHLSRREEEILGCLAEGLPNKLVAQQLDISIQTVKVHVRSILRKLGVQNRTEAALWATRNGISNRPTGQAPQETS